MNTGHQEMRRDLSQKLLNRIKISSPRFFEHLDADILTAMDYGGSRKDAGEAWAKVAMEAFDGIINEDKLGLDAIYL